MATRLTDDLKERSWPEVLKTLGDELRNFIQQEMELVKTELSSKIKQAGMGAGMFGAAGFLGLLAAGALTAALILGLALVVAPWAAALIVAGFYGLVAGILALTGKKKVQSATPLAPEQALRTVQAAKVQMQHAWERGSNQPSPPVEPTHTRTGNGPSAPAAEATVDIRDEPPAQSPGSSERAVPFRNSPPRY